MAERAQVLGHNRVPFRYPGLELFAPARGNILRPIAENRITSKRTGRALVSVARTKEGQRMVIVDFPEAGVYFPITTTSELQKWRDGFDAMLDQIRRPKVEAL